MIVENYMGDLVREEGKKPYFVPNPNGEWHIVECIQDDLVYGYIDKYHMAGYQMTVKKDKDDA